MDKDKIEKIADTVLSGKEIVYSARTWEVFKNTPKSDLINYHNTIGRDIRNAFQLWKLKWKPVIKNGTDVSKDHPDAVSMKILEAIWKKLNS